MRKLYYSQRVKEKGVTILVYQFNDQRIEETYILKHVVKHSPTGLEFGYGGAGPADAALSILTDFLDDQSKADLAYQKFKFDFIAKFQHTLSITGFEIRNWLKENFPQIRIPVGAM